MKHRAERILTLPVIIGALGYFVDIFDIVLFSTVRVASLKELGVSESHVLSSGVWLLDLQMIGLLLGGIGWGILGDRRGRVSVLLSSILLYSVATLLNAFVDSVAWYGVWRFVAGFGLAGELGAAVTLVTEMMSPRNRGYGTMVVASFGLFGATAAGWVGSHLPWRTTYLVGASLGIALLLARTQLKESHLYQSIQSLAIRRGDWRLIIASRERFWRFVRCVAIGVPIWFVVGIIITFSPEIAKALGVVGEISVGKAIFYHYLGASAGDFFCGFLSQKMKSRKKAVLIFQVALASMACLFLCQRGLSVFHLYWLVFFLGIATGYWAVFITVAAEQFGTNLRATVAISVPNLVRGSVVPLTLMFETISKKLGIPLAACLVGLCCFLASFLSLLYQKESFGSRLDYIESPTS